MATPKFNADRARRVLTDAALLGDATACGNWKITRRTLERYRARLAGDQELSEVVALKAKQDELEWGAQRRAFLAEGLRKMRDLVADATIEHLHDVAGAVKIAGDLQVATEVLGVGSVGTDREGPATPPTAGDADGQEGLEPLQH